MQIRLNKGRSEMSLLLKIIFIRLTSFIYYIRELGLEYKTINVVPGKSLFVVVCLSFERESHLITKVERELNHVAQASVKLKAILLPGPLRRWLMDECRYAWLREELCIYAKV